MSKYWRKKIKHLFVAGLYQLILVSKPFGDIQYHHRVPVLSKINHSQLFLNQANVINQYVKYQTLTISVSVIQLFLDVRKILRVYQQPYLCENLFKYQF